MKKCTYCGKQYADETPVCPVDGQPLANLAPTAPPPFPIAMEHQTVRDEEHLRLLAIFHFVGAGLAFFAIGFLFLHFLLLHSVLSNPEIWQGHGNAGPPPKFIMSFMVGFYVAGGVFLGGSCIVNVLSGIFLQRRRHRVFSLVVGGFNCLHLPFGTILGVFTIVTLSRDSVRKLYGG